MPQQQAPSPVALAQRYAHLHLAPHRHRRFLISTILLITALLFLWFSLPRNLDGLLPPLTFLLVILLVYSVLMLLTPSHILQREEDELYAQLLALVKDSVLPLPLAEQVALLVALPPTTPPPLPALAQARLAQKLAYASAAELTPLPRAPLYAWLAAAETPDELKIALLLALGSLHDLAIRPLAQELATAAPTERLREAALECLKSLETAR